MKKLLTVLTVIFLVLWAGIAIGSADIGLGDIFSIMGNKLFSLPTEVSSAYISIVWDIRFPRVLLAFFIGGALAVSGTVSQSILRNPLASPYTLGVSSGASLGSAIVILTGFNIPFLGSYSLPFVGFISALITVTLAISFAYKVDKTMANTTIILTGMVFSLFANAILTTITALAHENVEALVVWQMGSFAMRGWKYLKMFLPFAIFSCIGIYKYAGELDILTFGEQQAQAIGVDAPKVKKILFILMAILTGAAVSLTGTIGFVDLIAPHLTRKIFGSKHRVILPAAFAVGGCMMVITDLVARTIISPSELPVGAITALIGAPFFIYIYFYKTK